MAPWESLHQLKELCDRLSADDAVTDPAETRRVLALLVHIVETQHHDIQVLKSAVARLEHRVLHRHSVT